MGKWIKKWVLRAIVFFFAFSILITLPLKFINPALWSWQLQRDFFPPKGYKQYPPSEWVSLENISPHMQLAVIASEDQRFPFHHGVDFDSTQKAISDMISGDRFRGASTLTQQTVKNLYLWSGKDLIRKAVEAYLSILVEFEWGKERILEMYLNIVEFGPGIFGVEAASKHYFGVRPSQLSASQAARLAAVLPNPYLFKVQNPTPYIWKRVAWIETQMKQLGLGYLKELN
ncbi:monofunctional biosynthetic peptidoglycan transglycosylase [Vibrio rumoiensis]|uniref:Biosynthetic peptidoglycan transglycosylase n=1 Tax=Vibrio rumoiensis 1S-45 TaxID=1188252 RepID=A0A1E5E2X9_9VIBR|nr:monofunctional biosynthetic peptidoglycan transglycosylase [Vibrio rumoiensis]OEF25860.1 monofunctional biosynthetic peptidoglycan transglycosylase [Vibrio rumoiensis 1S-45]